MNELCCEYLSEWCIWLYLLLMSCMRFKVNPYSVVAWMSQKSLLKTGVKSFKLDVQSFKLQILRLFQARSSLTFRQLYSIDSLWNAYVTWQEHTLKCTIQISTHNTAQSFCLVCLNGWVFVYELSGCGFESSYSHIT